MNEGDCWPCKFGLSTTSSEARNHQCREAGPPHQPQHQLRSPLAQRGPPTAPKKINQGRRKPSITPPLHLKMYPSINRITILPRIRYCSCVAVAAPRVGSTAAFARPRDPKNSPSRCRQSNQSMAVALRTGCTVARRVGCQRMFMFTFWRV